MAADNTGQEVTFAPSAPAGATHAAVDGHSLSDLACPSTAQCTAVDDQGNAVTFDPGSPGATNTVRGASGPLAAIDCPLVSQCTAAGQAGEETTFDPASSSNPTAVKVDGGTALLRAGCPASSQCTAIDADGAEVTFHPGSASGVTRAQIATATGTPTNGTWISCPSASWCVALAQQEPGTVLGFDPASPGAVTRTAIPSSSVLTGLACPSSSECVLTDNGGEEITMNPHTGTFSSAVIDSANPYSLGPVACPGTTQCTAVAGQSEVTFNPQSPGKRTSATVDPASGTEGMLAVACPTTSQCSATDDVGNEVSFDPATGHAGAPMAVDAGHRLVALACPTANLCLTTDGVSTVFEGDPTRTSAWTGQFLGGADGLNDVACAAYTECVAVDTVGDVFTGRQSAPVPPRLSNVHQAHRRWREPARRGRRTRSTAPVGTSFSFRLNQPATVTLTVTQKLPGRRVGGRCRAVSRRNKHRARCTRTIVLRKMSIRGHTGSNRFGYLGRQSRTRYLKPGTYSVVIVATSSSGHSAPKSLTFTIVA